MKEFNTTAICDPSENYMVDISERVMEHFIAEQNRIHKDKTEKFLEEEGRERFITYVSPIINGTGTYSVEEQLRDHRRTDHMGEFRNLFEHAVEAVEDMGAVPSKKDTFPKINIYFRTPEDRDNGYEMLKALPLEFAYTETTSLEMTPKNVSKGTVSKEIPAGQARFHQRFLKYFAESPPTAQSSLRKSPPEFPHPFHIRRPPPLQRQTGTQSRYVPED